MADIPVTVVLRADGRGLQGTLTATERDLRRLEGQTDRNTRSTRRFNRQTTSARQRLSGFALAARAAVGALALRELAQAADQMTLLNARLRLVTEGQEAFNAAQESVTRIANENGTALGAVSELYTRLAQSSTDLRDNQEELDTITQAITQSMRVSGSSATESAGAIRQLSQAFASGVLRGDEFNSVNEQAPRLLQAVADSLEKERGELRALAEQGELTSDILTRALVDQADTIAQEAAQIPQTMGQAVQVVQNNLLRLISALDTATGGTGSVTSFINRIGNAVESLAVLIEENYLEIQLAGIALGQAFATMAAVIGAAIQGVEATVTEMVNRITNQYKEASAELFDFIAGIQEQRAQVAGLIPGLGDLENSLKGQAFAYRATAKATRQTMAEEQDLSEVLGRVAFELKERLGTIEDNASAMVDQAIAASQSSEATDEAAEAQDRLGQSTSTTTELTEDQIESMRDFAGTIADLAAQLDGPYQQAVRKFQSDAAEVGELFRTQQITGGQAADMLELLEERYRRAAFEIGQNFADEIEELALNGLPAVVREMLGLADATDRVADSAERASAFGRIGSNFAQSIVNGQSIANSIESALTGFAGQGISEEFGDLFSDAIEGSFEDVFESEAFRKNSAEGFALAIGQAINGDIGQAAFTAAGNAIGGPIGAIIGSIIGDALFGGSTPKFQVRGVDSDVDDAGTDRLVDGPLGRIEFAFRGIEDQAKSQIVRAFTEFDQSIAGVIRDESQLEAVQEALDRFGVSSRSGPDNLEAQLELRFDVILGTFDNFTQQFVNVATTLEDRVQRLADIFAIENRLLLGQGFGLAGNVGDFGGGAPPVPIDPGFGGGGGISPVRPPAQVEAFNAAIQGTGDAADVTNPVLQQTLALLDDLSIGGESLVDTFDRLSTVVNGLDRVAGLAGAQFADTREGLVRFGSELVSIFGDDAGAFSGLLNRVLEAAFSDEQLAQQTIDAARQRATDLLTGLGIAVTEETFTQGGLQDLLSNFLGALGPEETAQLLTAGDAIATLIEAQGRLADSTDEVTESIRDAAAVGEILQGLETDAARAALEGVDRALFDLANRRDSVVERLEDIGATAQEIAQAESLFADERLRIIEQFAEQAAEAERRRLEQIGGIFEGLETEAARAGLEGVDLALFNLANRRDSVVERLEDIGATAQEIAQAESLFADERLRIIEQFAEQAAEAERRRLEQIGGIFDSLETEAAREELQGLNLALFDSNQRFDELRQRIIEFGGSQQDLLQLEQFRLEEERRLRQEALAETQQFLRDVGQQALQVIAPARASFADLARQIAETFARADELNLAEGQLNIVRLAATAQTLQLVAALEDQLEASIDAFRGVEEQSQQATQQIQSGISNTRDAWLRAIDSIQSALDQQLVGNNSSLTNRGRLNAIEGQLEDAVQAALAGDVGAAQQVAQLFQQAIGQGAAFFGTSTDNFADFEQRLRDLVGSVPAGITVPPEQRTAENTGELLRIEQERLRKEEEQGQTREDQLRAAINIVDVLGILATVTGQTPSEIGDEFGAPIRDVIQTLTGELPGLTGDALSGFFDNLVNSINEDLNELSGIEAEAIEQTRLIGDTNSILRDIFRELGGVRTPEDRRDALVGNGPDDRSDLRGLAEGGITTGPTRALIGEAGPEAVIPLNRISDNKGIERRLERIEAALLTGNSDRRTAAEIEIEIQERLVAAQQQKRRTDQDDILRAFNR